MKETKVIAVDLDATITAYTEYTGVDGFDEPLPGAIEALEELRRRGHKIIIWTTRPITPALEDYLERYRIPYDGINTNLKEVGIHSEKVRADVYIDDRAITFNNNWSEILSTIDGFEPWYTQRKQSYKNKGKVIWLTGLPCSGKTTIARALIEGIRNAVLLDGDEIRKTISADLGFSAEDRKKHLIRVCYIADTIATTGMSVICAFVSPIKAVRNRIRKKIGKGFIEVYVKASKEVCEERDTKGMWAKAKAGEIKNFTGLTAPYEPPNNADVICNTAEETVEQSTQKVLAYLNKIEARALYIGRWQPFHKGHEHIINQSLEKGIPVLIAVRDMHQDENNPYKAEEIKVNIEKVFEGRDVEVIIIPNIKSVNIGRKVGYDIIKIKAPEDIELISATGIRKRETKKNKD